MIKDVGNRRFVGRVQEIGRRLARLRHAHVERTVTLKRETPLGLIELHRGDADIQHHAINADIKRLIQTGKFAVDQGQPGLGRDQRLGGYGP